MKKGHWRVTTVPVFHYKTGTFGTGSFHIRVGLMECPDFGGIREVLGVAGH